MVIVEHGLLLQIVSLIDKGPAATNGRLKPGDVLLKVGPVNVMGYQLRELQRLLHGLPAWSNLQVAVYRDYINIPAVWKNNASQITGLPEKIKERSEQSIKDEGSEEWTSDEDYDDAEASNSFLKPTRSFWHDSTTILPSISKAWHAKKKTKKVFSVGIDIGYDIMIHRPFYDNQTDFDSSFWCDTDSSSSSSSD
ncbi:PDZ domain-containing protein 9-like [Polyodon spathula]|uniref:PDZ domain-containing protein 9-like n=1 Tax=Polyodon spathula TaxID=7913 RepID=UPI001B7F5615|nr:PDZ domain-containing protein 9-like [Polyodon spathula]